MIFLEIVLALAAGGCMAAERLRRFTRVRSHFGGGGGAVRRDAADYGRYRRSRGMRAAAAGCRRRQGGHGPGACDVQGDGVIRVLRFGVFAFGDGMDGV